MEASASASATNMNSSSSATLLPLTANAISIYNKLQVKMTPRNKMPVHPGSVKNSMDELTDKFVGYEQRDAHEFFSDLIDFLHEERVYFKKNVAASASTAPGLANGSITSIIHTSGANNHNNGCRSGTGRNKENDNKGEKDNDPGNEQQAVADQTTTASFLSHADAMKKNDETTTLADNADVDGDDFCLTAEVGLKCLSCGYFRTKEEIYRYLSLDIIAPSTQDVPCSLYTSLEHFFQPGTHEITCERCADGAHASQSLRIVKRPKTLLLHLKRFIVVE